MWAIRPTFILISCAALAGARRIVQEEEALTEAQTEVSSAAVEQAASESNTSGEIVEQAAFESNTSAEIVEQAASESNTSAEIMEQAASESNTSAEIVERAASESNTSGEISRKSKDHRFCIDEDTSLVCGDGFFIVVKSAYYNRAKRDLATRKTCSPVAPSPAKQDGDPCAPENTRSIKEQCDGYHTCTLRVQDHKSCATRPWTFMRVNFGCEAGQAKDEPKPVKQVATTSTGKVKTSTTTPKPTTTTKVTTTTTTPEPTTTKATTTTEPTTTTKATTTTITPKPTTTTKAPTTTTTTMATTGGAPLYTQVGTNKRCTMGNMIKRWPGPTGKSLQECAQECQAVSDCEYFGSWPAEGQGGVEGQNDCRIYRAPCEPYESLWPGYSNILYQLTRQSEVECEGLTVEDFAGEFLTVTQESTLHGSATYTYEITIGEGIVQKTNDAGNFNLGSHHSYNGMTETFSNGDSCGKIKRSATIIYTIGTELKLEKAHETSMCVYEYQIQIPGSMCKSKTHKAQKYVQVSMGSTCLRQGYFDIWTRSECLEAAKATGVMLRTNYDTEQSVAVNDDAGWAWMPVGCSTHNTDSRLWINVKGRNSGPHIPLCYLKAPTRCPQDSKPGISGHCRAGVLCCLASWTASCGESCHRKRCEAAGGNWIYGLDHNHASYHCEMPYSNDLARARTTNGKGNVAAGTKCILPFTYKGKVFHDCLGTKYGGHGWCSTGSYRYEDQKRWGGCAAPPKV